MAPKARAKDSSPAPKPKPKAAKAKAKAEAKPAEDPKAEMMKEAQDMFEKYSIEGEGGVNIVKLKEFAQCIRDMNIRKVHIWGDDPSAVIKEQWKETGGFAAKELSKETFVNWWPTFLELVQRRIDEVEAVEAEKEAKKKEEVDKMKAIYDSDGVWPIQLPKLQDALDKAFQKGKTPLILDTTEGHRSEVFFTYSSAYIIECKKMIMDKAKGGQVSEILEEARDRFFEGGHCFKYGSTVVFRLANSACDIRNTFSTEEFPSMKLLDATEVAKVLGPENADNFKESPFYKMCKTDDQRLEHTTMGVNDKFRVVAVSHFPEEDYEGFLKDMFPLELMQPMKVLVE